MRNLIVAAALLLASTPAWAGAPPPTTEEIAPAEERRPPVSTTTRPRPAPRPSTTPPKGSSTEPPRYEPAPRRPPLAEPFTPPRRDTSYPPTKDPTPGSNTYPPTQDRPAPREEPTWPSTPRDDASGPPPKDSPDYVPVDRPDFVTDREVPDTRREFAPSSPKVARPAFDTPIGEPVKRAFEGPQPDPLTRHAVDHRTHRPPSHHVHDHRYPYAHHGPPHGWYYYPCYASWWVHPYYRWMYTTWVIVDLPFYASAWDPYWGPPVRNGWMWVPGQWVGPYWYPGHWAPLAPAPYMYGTQYVYVPGFWYGGSYFDGYWRVAERSGFTWVETRYVDQTPSWGHWRPRASPAQDGYVWEPGFWNGQDWVEGFWRPDSRVGYRWVSAAYDESGLYHAGYWEPLEDRPGHVWIPGWFDGVEWVQGYWVTDSEYREADPESWTPPDGWDEGTGIPAAVRDDDDPPLAIPID